MPRTIVPSGLGVGKTASDLDPPEPTSTGGQVSTLAELFYLLPTEGVKILPFPFSRQSGSPDCLTLQFTLRDGGLSAYWWDFAIYGYTSLEPVHRHQGSPYLPDP